MIGLALRFSKCRPPIFADVLMFRHQKFYRDGGGQPHHPGIAAGKS
jgi:hypothetical protein